MLNHPPEQAVSGPLLRSINQLNLRLSGIRFNASVTLRAQRGWERAMNAFRSRRDKAAAAYDILPPDAIGSHQRRAALGRTEVVDAHFVPVTGEARPAAPHRSQNDNKREARRPRIRPAEKPVSLLARLTMRIEQGLMRMSADFFSAVVAFVFVMVFGLSGGFSLISGMSGDTAEAAGLDITHVTLTPQDADGLKVLLINGVVENRARASLAVPAIRADIMVDGRMVSSLTIAPPVSEMPQDHSRGFSARMPHPGGKNPQLRLSFVEMDATRS
jgi:hypothetical protein